LLISINSARNSEPSRKLNKVSNDDFSKAPPDASVTSAALEDASAAVLTAEMKCSSSIF